MCHILEFVLCLSEKHRGFAFVEFELAEDAAAAMDNMVSRQLVDWVYHYILIRLLIYSLLA